MFLSKSHRGDKSRLRESHLRGGRYYGIDVMTITDYYLRNGADETVAKNSTWGLMWWRKRKMSRIFTSSQLGRQCLHASSGTWAADNTKGLNFSYSKNLHWCLLNWTAAQGSHIGVSVFGRYLKIKSGQNRALAHILEDCSHQGRQPVLFCCAAKLFLHSSKHLQRKNSLILQFQSHLPLV